MREFKSFGDFAAHLNVMPKLHEAAILKAVAKSAEIVEFTAKEKIGFYQTQVGPFDAWTELKQSTKNERVRQGWTENDPLLRSGELRDSINSEVGHPQKLIFNAAIGSDADIAAYQELGTNRIPPRPFIGPAMYEQEHLIKHMLGNASMAVLAGKLTL
ncbi:MAG: hypothetical protein ACXWAT_15925 [Methylobacter sp.]